MKISGRAAGGHRAFDRFLPIFDSYALLGRFLPRLGSLKCGPIFFRRQAVATNGRHSGAVGTCKAASGSPTATRSHKSFCSKIMSSVDRPLVGGPYAAYVLQR